MQPSLDPDLFDPSPSSAQPSSKSTPRDLPDIHERPQRRMPMMVVAGLVFLGTGIAFYGAEALLPRPYKPSTLIGSYTAAIHEATKTGELAAQIRYDGQLREVELHYQDRLKRIETAAVQWQDQCRAGLLNVTNHYQAALQQANIFAQGVVQLQAAYQQMRNQIVSGTLGGEIGLVNMATTLAPFVALLDPNVGAQLSQFAHTYRSQLLATFDRLSRGGNTVSVKGWDARLPRPEMMRTMIRCDLPVFQTGVPTAPIAAPRVASPAR